MKNNDSLRIAIPVDTVDQAFELLKGHCDFIHDRMNYIQSGVRGLFTLGEQSRLLKEWQKTIDKMKFLINLAKI